MDNKMRQEKIKVALNESLHPGEKVLWQSDTEHFGLLSGVGGRRILIRGGITLVVMLGIIGGYVAAAPDIKTNVVLIMLVILALLLLSPVMEWRSLQGQKYLLTNQRAILVRGDQQVFSMPVQDIDDAQILQLSPEETLLLLGSRMMEEPRRNLRFWASHPLGSSESGKEVQGLVFYAVRNAEQALQMISRQVAA